MKISTQEVSSGWWDSDDPDTEKGDDQFHIMFNNTHSA
jgi:hypothetical protein